MMATLSTRVLAILLLLSALLLRLNYSQESRSSTSRRETSDGTSRSDTYVGHSGRAEALRSVCSEAHQGIINEIEADFETESGVFNRWLQIDNPFGPDIFTIKPITSRSRMMYSFAVLIPT